MDKEVMVLGELKLYIASGIFVCITAVKLLFPSYTEEIRREVVALIDMDMDYRNLITQVGTILTDGTVREVFSMHDHTAEESDQGIIPSQPIEETPVPSEEMIPEPIPASVLAAVEAFHLSQEAYSDYVTPDNVSYDSLFIPFTYDSPVNGVLSSGFGYRVHPIDDVVLFHYGTDYDVVEGTAVSAFADGTVKDVGEEYGYGNYVVVSHGEGWESLYAHCSAVSVGIGQSVEKGAVIAYSGQTGRVTGPHLHFELTHDGLYTNPEFFLS